MPFLFALMRIRQSHNLVFFKLIHRQQRICIDRPIRPSFPVVGKSACLSALLIKKVNARRIVILVIGGDKDARFSRRINDAETRRRYFFKRLRMTGWPKSSEETNPEYSCDQ